MSVFFNHTAGKWGFIYKTYSMVIDSWQNTILLPSFTKTAQCSWQPFQTTFLQHTLKWHTPTFHHSRSYNGSKDTFNSKSVHHQIYYWVYTSYNHYCYSCTRHQWCNPMTAGLSFHTPNSIVQLSKSVINFIQHIQESLHFALSFYNGAYYTSRDFQWNRTMLITCMHYCHIHYTLALIIHFPTPVIKKPKQHITSTMPTLLSAKLYWCQEKNIFLAKRYSDWCVLGTFCFWRYENLY